MEQNVQPQYEVEVLEGKVTRTMTNFEDGQLVTKEVEEDAGYMVYFPQGHSIRVRNYTELKRMGLSAAPGLIDMESGEEVAPPQTRSLKSHVESKTKPSRNRKEN